MIEQRRAKKHSIEPCDPSASNYCFGAPAYPGPGRSRARISELRRCRASGYRVHCYTAGAVRVSFSNRGASRGWSGKYGRLASSYTSSGDRRCSVPGLLHKSRLEGDTSVCGNCFRFLCGRCGLVNVQATLLASTRWWSVARLHATSLLKCGLRLFLKAPPHRYHALAALDCVGNGTCILCSPDIVCMFGPVALACQHFTNNAKNSKYSFTPVFARIRHDGLSLIYPSARHSYDAFPQCHPPPP